VNKKVLILITAVLVGVLASSILVMSLAGACLNPKPEYVMYDFRTLQTSGVVTNEKVTGSTVVLDEYFPDTTIVTANATINGVTYYYPQDFDYNVTVHLEFDSVTGYGICMLYETLYFNNLPWGHSSCSTLVGMASEKASGLTSHATSEFNGYFQLTGTGIFRNVQGSGIAMKGVSTNMNSWHIAWISGWPL